MAHVLFHQLIPDTDDKFENCAKKPATGRRRRRPPVEKPPVSDSSDDDGFSSTNTTSRRSRSKSIDKEKRTRGRPKKVQPAVPATVITPPKTTPKKETAKKPTRSRAVRQNSTVKSREFVATESSSEDEATPPATGIYYIHILFDYFSTLLRVS